MMDARSLNNMRGLFLGVVTRVEAAAAKLEPTGIFLCVYAPCLRTLAQQNLDFAEGRTLPGKIVTNARGGQSMHNYGLAVDVVPYLSGDGGNINWNPTTTEYQEMVTELKAAGMDWGGDWPHFKDEDHFQFGGLPMSPTPAMINDLGNGDSDALMGIWANVAAGKYGSAK
jgi:peptidoglycan LD-endopeptidase CwlK